MEELNHASIDKRREEVIESAKELGAKKCLTPQEERVMSDLNLLTLKWLEDQKN